MYDITNNGSQDIAQSYAGLLCDFDVVPTDGSGEFMASKSE